MLKELIYTKVVTEGCDNLYKIAICDDEKVTCSELENIILDIAKNMDLEFEVDIFYTGEALCQYLEQDNYYEIIFLDIELANITGIEVGNFIRNNRNDEKSIIIYISSKEQYALRLFRVRPFDFLIKPLEESTIKNTIVEVLKIINRNKTIFEYQIGKSLYRQKFGDIIYFRSDKRKIVIVTMNENIEFYSNLTTVKKQLPTDEFIQVHKSYIINFAYAKEYTYEWVKMVNNEVISISKPYRKAVRNRILQDRRE